MPDIQYNHQTREISVPYRDETGAERVFNALIGGLEEPTPALPPAPPKPPKLSLFGELKGGNNWAIKTRSIINNGDGQLECAPYVGDRMTFIDLETDKITQGQPIRELRGQRQAYVDGKKAPNGWNIYNPHRGPGFLARNPATGEQKFIGSSWQCRGSDFDENGVMHAVRYSGLAPLRHVFRLDTNSMEMLPDIIYDNRPDGEVYKTRPNWENDEIPNWAYGSLWGATTAGDGRIIGTAYGSDRPLIIDPVEERAWLADYEVTGGAGIPLESEKSSLYLDTYWTKCSGGTRSRITGNVIMFPRGGNVITEYDHKTQTFKDYPLPPELTQTNLSRSFSSAEGPDGLIYSSLWHSPYIFWFNPVTKAIGYMRVPEELLEETQSPNALWFTYGAAAGDSIIYALGRSRKSLKLTPDKSSYLTPVNS